LQLSYAYENPCCNHDTMIEKGTSNYLEWAKHAIDCHDNLTYPFYMLNYPMLLDPTYDMQWHAFSTIIWWYIKCQCIGRKWDFVVISFMLCVVFCHPSF
jgi:hypothetical protein